MPFGAHETMETHDILMEEMNMINHLALYSQQCQAQHLQHMIQNHLQHATQSYQSLVHYTHNYSQPQVRMTSELHQHVQPQNIQYGLHQPAPQTPQLNVTQMNDQQIAQGLLSLHKNSAKNHMIASLECADPNVRQMMVNGALACEQQAYEVFLYMNSYGMYQVPTMDDHTAKTLLHSYQIPAQAEQAYMQTDQTQYSM